MIRLLAATLALSLTSCGLIKAPFKIVGGVTKATTNVVKQPIDAHKKRKDKKKQEKAKAEAKKKQEEAMKNRQSSGDLPPGLTLPTDTGAAELPSVEPDLPPLPSEYQDPLPLPE